MQAHGGIMSITGVEGGEPVRVGCSIVDQGAGMWAAMGILAALNRRHVTGEGCHVSTSLFETAIGWMGAQIGAYLSGGPMRRPMGSGVAEIVPHQAFPTSDGYIMVAAGNDNLFRALCGALDFRVCHRSAFRHELEARREPPHADPDAGGDLPRAVDRRVADAARCGGRAGGPDRERRAGRGLARRPQRSACCRRRPTST